MASTTTSAYFDSPAESSSTGKIHRDDVVAPATQLCLHEVPVPTDIACAMDQRIGGHVLPLILRRARVHRRGEEMYQAYGVVAVMLAIGNSILPMPPPVSTRICA